MKILFLAYRDWALRVANRITDEYRNTVETEIITSPDALTAWHSNASDARANTVIMAVGWSWIIDASITESQLCLGVHPSDLPLYRGGSPIQNQILDGILKTKCSLFQITAKLDAGSIWGKTDLELAGDSIEEIFRHIENAAVVLISDFIKAYPDILATPQNISAGSYVKRRKPDDSRILPTEIDFVDLTSLYNKIRALTDPYPNAYLEDKLGNRIYFERISFQRGNSAS